VFKSIMVGAALIVLPVSAFAQPGNNGGGNGGCGVGQQTNGCGGTGGAGGTGVGVGVGIGIAAQQQGQVQGQSQSSYNKNSNTNVNANANSNRNSNRNNNTATGGSASSSSNARGGDQSQGQEVNNQGAGSNSNNYNAPAIPVSSATAPSFAIGSCQWAFSGGLQLFGAGVSAGSAGMYEFCKALMKSKHMSEVGERDVAKALECQDSSIRAAYKTAGKPCIEDMPRQVAAVVPQQTVVPVLAPAAQTLPSNCRVVQPGNYITCE
jgi:hypothetical protein